MDPNVIGPATLAITQSFTAFNALLPKFGDIHDKHPSTSPAFADEVRMGEIAASALSIGIGLIVSSLTRSSVPVTVSVIMALGLVTMYEKVLRSNSLGG